MKRKRVITSMVILTVCIATVAQAIPTVETDHKVVNEYIWDTPLGSWNPNAVWYHDNPYTGDYEAALTAGNILSVTLTINAEGITPCDDQVAVTFRDKNGISHALPGFLSNGNNVYDIDKTWLDSVKVTAAIDWNRSSCFDWLDDACIKWSDLTVTSDIAVIPAPGALMLSGLGVSLIGWLRRQRML